MIHFTLVNHYLEIIIALIVVPPHYVCTHFIDNSRSVYNKYNEMEDKDKGKIRRISSLPQIQGE